jgi:hypothetical protein
MNGAEQGKKAYGRSKFIGVKLFSNTTADMAGRSALHPSRSMSAAFDENQSANRSLA